MKNRRNLIVAFLLCACLIVGIGYAAIADQLEINGTLEYSPTAANLENNVYFTGEMKVVNGEHAEVDTDAFIVNVNGGSQVATVTAHFTANNIVNFKQNSNYVSGIVLQVAVENTSDSENLVVNFGSFATNGTVGTQSAFAVETILKDGDTEAATNVTENITVDPGATKYVYVHMKITAQESMVTENKTVEPVDFTVILPVTKVG